MYELQRRFQLDVAVEPYNIEFVWFRYNWMCRSLLYRHLLSSNNVWADPHKNRICPFLSVSHAIEFSEKNDMLVVVSKSSPEWHPVASSSVKCALETLGPHHTASLNATDSCTML